MPRMSLEDVLAAVADVITGEFITHNDLVAALEANNQAAYVQHLPNLLKSGMLKTTVAAVPDGKPELRYSLPE